MCLNMIRQISEITLSIIYFCTFYRYNIILSYVYNFSLSILNNICISIYTEKSEKNHRAHDSCENSSIATKMYTRGSAKQNPSDNNIKGCRSEYTL